MSYCRWSNDDYQCDVYCYADCAGGYTTHVASNRPVLDIELPPPVFLTEGNVDAWMERENQVQAWLNRAERKPIGLPHDGKTFWNATAEEAANTLKMLQDMGYNVPQHAIDMLRAEAKKRA